MSYNGPINPNPGDGEASIVIYGYIPSRALGAVGAATFGLALVAHFGCLIRDRGTRAFYALTTLAAMQEVVGYVFRLMSTRNPFKVIYFIIQYFLIVTAPVFLAAAMYLALAIGIKRVHGGSRFLPMKPKTFVTWFVVVDTVCTALQISGAALIGVSESANAEGRVPPITTKAANDILLAGLAAQSASLLVYLTILVRVIRKRLHRDTNLLEDHEQISLKLLWVLLGTSLLIFLRTIFRLAETAQGVFGFASTSEALFGTLEFFPIILAMGAWSFWPLNSMVPDRDAHEEHEKAMRELDIEETGSTGETRQASQETEKTTPSPSAV